MKKTQKKSVSVEKQYAPHCESARVTVATQFVTLPGDYGTDEFIFHRGGKLKNITVAYESWGELNRNKDNAVLIFTGLSPTAHASSSLSDVNPGWWEYMIGPNKAIDTNRFYVLCVNSLGGCFGSTGPACHNPVTGQPYNLSFPELTIEDIAKAGHHALQSLGIDHLHAVVGSSMGGMTSLAYALQYPEEVDYLVSISAAARAMPATIAIRSLQREIVRNDPAWQAGNYLPSAEPINGMLTARKLGLISYRSAEEWRLRFDRTRIDQDRRSAKAFSIEFEVESYLEHNARKFAENFDANSYLYLSRAMDLFDVADHGGSVNAGLAKVRCKKSLIIGVSTDTLFPVQQQQELADGISKAGGQVQYEELNSPHGHDSFLIDEARFVPAVKKFFSDS